ncbi:hypothetical protein [Streptomyces sp. NPDC050263]|uniref:hypothetical protein n=1 Tax=Streptomyces sp. NPDC050263 TaxID=3155037 RepID=UPI003440BB80
MPERTADGAGQEQGLGDIAEGGPHLLGQGGSGAEAALQPAPAQVVLDRFARVVVLPVATQGEVEGGHRPAERGDGKTDGEDDAFEIHARGAREIDTDRQSPLLGVGRRFPLRRRSSLRASDASILRESVDLPIPPTPWNTRMLRRGASKSSTSKSAQGTCSSRRTSHLLRWSADVRGCPPLFVGVVTQLDTQGCRSGQGRPCPVAFVKPSYLLDPEAVLLILRRTHGEELKLLGELVEAGAGIVGG